MPFPKESKKKQVAERLKKIASTKEKILAKKRFIVKIVENMIEEDVTKNWFLSNCTYLCQADFDDVVQERNIESLCGYPLCSNFIKETVKQKYHISPGTNKVYDLTERKCFCSNECYKASNYVKAQLSPIPLYMRKEETIQINLLSESDNKGSAGEEIQFHHKIPQMEVHRVYTEEITTNLQNLLNEDVKKCADSLSGLQIKEHLFEKQYVFSDETPNKSDNSTLKDKNGSEDEFDSDDSIDEKLFPSYHSELALSNKHMPVPDKIKKSVLIPPQKPEFKSTPQASELSLHFVRKVFKDWITEDTLKYLMGEKYIYGVKADHLFKTMTESDFSCSEKLASIKEQYIKLCLKIDSLPDDDELDLINESSTNSNVRIETENNSAKKVFKRRPRKSKDKNKRVTFALENKTVEPEQKVETSKREKDETNFEKRVTVETEQKAQENTNLSTKKQSQFETNESSSSSSNVDNLKSIEKTTPPVEQKSEKNVKLLNKNTAKAHETVLSSDVGTEKEPPPELSEPEPSFPLVDSDAASQNIFRRQVLTKNLKSVYTDLLPIAGLHYTDIREDMRKFIDSLSLTPTNIIYKPKEWKLISLVLFRMLTRTVLKDLHDELQFAKLCENPLMPITVDLREVENLVCELVSTENIITIH